MSEIGAVYKKGLAREGRAGWGGMFLPLLLGCTVVFYAWNQRTRAVALEELNADLVRQNTVLRLELRALQGTMRDEERGSGE